MKRPWHIAVLFSLSMAVVLAVMAWVSATVLRLDRAQSEAQRQAAIEENVRLALWRMDSAVASLIAQESARPWTAYGSWSSPALLLPQVVLHFQIGPDGRVCSPEVISPPGSKGSPGEPAAELVSARDVLANRLRTLRTGLAGVMLAAQLPPIASQPTVSASPQRWQQTAQANMQGQQAGQQQSELYPVPQQSVVAQRPAQQEIRNAQEFQARSQNAAQFLNVQPQPPAASPDLEASIGMLRPLWQDDRLLLARRVSVGGAQYVQGAWLDWDVIRRELLASVADLLPRAQLVTVREIKEPREVRMAHMLATLPVRLLPGEIEIAADATRSPLLASLAVAWACVLLAGAAVAALLVNAVALSERRAAFVSAVTHELRTPLTTLRMYAEMLAEGMITDETKRQSYLGTMRAEADRLGHLVENVLAYSRLERGRARRQVEDVSLDELLTRISPRIEQRAAQAGMTLCMEYPWPGGGADRHKTGDCPLLEGAGALVRVDVSAAEQVLFNLVDNACKYASGASDQRIHVCVVDTGDAPRIRVSDHGPGISSEQRARLFRPFSKSAHDAANSAPGVGLGLALSRRLAREMGGDLRLARAEGEGACFEFVLPCAPRTHQD